MSAKTRASSPGGTMIQSGTLAARPAFGIADRYYWATDIFTLFRDTGAAWEPVPRHYKRMVNSLHGDVPSSATNTALANDLPCIPVEVEYTLTVDGICWCNGGTAAGNVYLVVYRDSGAISPGARLWVSGIVALAGINQKQVAPIAPALQLTPGLYWIGLEASSDLDIFSAVYPVKAASAFGNPGGQNILPKYYSQALGAFIVPPDPFGGVEVIGFPAAGSAVWLTLRVSSIP